MEQHEEILKAVEGLFSYEEMGLRRFEKTTYAPSFEKFQEIAKEFGELLASFYEQCVDEKGTEAEQEEAKEEFCQSIALLFVEVIRDRQEESDSKMQREERQRDHNMFMATYVFPYIMEMRNPYYKQLAAAIEKSWSAAFKNSKIKAASFETVMGGFQRKFLGFSL
ncbi:MAG: hypothetical protein J1E61_01735 [Lachnospiraceae bacterium]|nr:hypothetical protein [Lachnospiraceae bacterium]